MSCDAYHMTDPHPQGEGAVLAMQIALDDAGVPAEEINYVNAHGTSTLVGDIAEVLALKRVLPNPEKVFMNSTKSMTGHCLGAAGGIEAIATIQTIKKSQGHPTINLDDPEPELTFQVPMESFPIDVRAAFSNSFGFGGHNATLVFGPWK